MGKDMKTLEPLCIIGENRKQHSLRGKKQHTMAPQKVKDMITI